MKEPVSIVLVGIGGMGAVYLTALLEKGPGGSSRLAGAVDPQPHRSPHLAALHRLGTPIFDSLEDFYRRRRADLAIVSSPIQFHSRQTILALAQGSHVLCEKPPAATIQEVRWMIEAEKEAKKWVAVGYQWSSSAAIQELKSDIQAGLYGRPKRLKCLYLWPRDETYYRRNDWAGKQKDAQGRWILDSPANNAMAHDLHNMFYILGEKRETSVSPVRVEAELYRAHDIENFDTAAIRCWAGAGVEILLFVSHATAVDTGPVLSYEFERGAVEAAGRDADIKGRYAGGVKSYGSPDREPLQKMEDAIEAVTGGTRPACGLEAAMSQTLCLNGAQDAMPVITDFPAELVSKHGEPGRKTVSVSGLDDVLRQCFEKNVLPSERGISWSRRGRPVKLVHYRNYPGGGKSDA
jgi:predicted dehydrogenase